MILAMTLNDGLAIPAVVILALTALAHLAATFARDHGHEELADELDTAHEALDVIAQAIQGHEHGETLGQDIADLEKSPEAQDLLQKVLKKAKA